MAEILETTKDTSRLAIIAAASTVVTYIIGKLFPGTPEIVVASILTLSVVAVDSYVHHRKDWKIKGLLPF